MNTKKTLHELGFRRRRDPVLEFFRPPGPPPEKPLPIKPDVDYPLPDQGEPQAPEYAKMWGTHFQNASMRNPLGVPLEWYELGETHEINP